MPAPLVVGRIRHGCEAEGPHQRSVVWVAGCSIRCPGCINPHLFERDGVVTTARAVADAVLATDDEGLTLVGGEPFDQPEACAEVAEAVRAAGRGVITFTGYEQSDLEDRSPATRRLLAATDLLVDGPFVRADPEPTRALVGSANQRFVHLTDRYRGYDPVRSPDRVEVRIDPAGEVSIAGFASRPRLRRLTAGIGVRSGQVR